MKTIGICKRWVALTTCVPPALHCWPSCLSFWVWDSGWWPQCLQDIATRQLMFVTYNQPMTSPRTCEPSSLCHAPYVKVIYAQGITELVSQVISVYSATSSVPFSNNTNNLLWLDLLFVHTSQLIKLGCSQDKLRDVVCYSKVVLRFWEESYTTDSRCSGLSPSVALFFWLITSYCLKDSEKLRDNSE